jgi:hypothetical protein
MRSLAIAVALTALLIPTAASANPVPNVVYFFDDVESGAGNWTTVDFTAGEVPHFHIDTYLAYDDPDHDEDLSWWCGSFEYDADGGYGNRWDDRLDLPTVHVDQVVVERTSWGAIKSRYIDEDGAQERDEAPRGVLPVLDFVYRHDSEPAFDYTYVQIDSAGTWVTLNGDGFDGSSGGWQELGTDGYSLAPYGSELTVRFRFLSDGAWSDQDGEYLSNGGAFHVDNIRIYDHVSGDVLFFEDCQGGGLCTPGVPEIAGDWWHIVDRKCPAYSDPHSWWCGDDADTSLIPPNLDNALITPYVDLSRALTCTVSFCLHAEVPTDDNDYWTYYATGDGGVSWQSIASYWGDFGQCNGWSTSGLRGYDLGFHGIPFGENSAFMFRFQTTDDGCGPGAAGGAGIFVDDVKMHGDGWLNEGAPSVGPVRPRPEPGLMMRGTDRFQSRGYRG